MEKFMDEAGFWLVVVLICSGLYGIADAVISDLNVPRLSPENRQVIRELEQVKIDHYTACIKGLYEEDLGSRPTIEESIARRDELRADLSFTPEEFARFKKRINLTRSVMVFGNWKCPDKPPAYTNSDGTTDFVAMFH